MPVLRQGPIVAQARQVRRLHRLLELSRMQIHPRPFAERPRRSGWRRRPAGRARARGRPGSGDEVTLRSGRFGDYVQLGEGEKPKRCSLPKGLSPGDVTLEKAVALLSLPREVAKHPDERRADRRRHRPLRLLCAARQDLRQSRPGRQRAGDRRQSRHRPDRRQGERRGGRGRFGADAGRALGDHPTWRGDHGAARAASAPMSITARSMRPCRREATLPR